MHIEFKITIKLKAELINFLIKTKIYYGTEFDY
jgi:hypothetical protein